MKEYKNVEEVMDAYHEQTILYIQRLKESIQLKQQSTSAICYIMYSLDINHSELGENLCFGSLTIKNTGSTTLKNPYVCLLLKKNSPFQFSGRYVTEHSNTTGMDAKGVWKRFGDVTNSEEYWLRPSIQEIKPGDSLTFSHFQLKWKGEEKYSGGVTGYFYSDEWKEGIQSLNSVHLQGSPGDKEVEKK